MVTYTTKILKFKEQGEKTGWTYIEVSAAIANKIKPGTKKIYRVKGRLDSFSIEQVAIMPMGNGDFIMPLNAAIRKGIRKRNGDTVKVSLEADDRELTHDADLIECLAEEPGALEFFQSQPKSQQNYFSKWIESAKTDATKAKRIAQIVNAMVKRQNFPEMIRALKAEKERGLS